MRYVLKETNVDRRDVKRKRRGSIYRCDCRGQGTWSQCWMVEYIQGACSYRCEGQWTWSYRSDGRGQGRGSIIVMVEDRGRGTISAILYLCELNYWFWWLSY